MDFVEGEEEVFGSGHFFSRGFLPKYSTYEVWNSEATTPGYTRQAARTEKHAFEPRKLYHFDTIPLVERPELYHFDTFGVIHQNVRISVTHKQLGTGVPPGGRRGLVKIWGQVATPLFSTPYPLPLPRHNAPYHPSFYCTPLH